MIEIPFSFLEYTNFLILTWFIIAIYRGYKRGLILQVVDLATTLVSLFAAWILSPVFQNVYHFFGSSNTGFVEIAQLIGLQANRLVWFVILFVLIRIVLMIIRPLAAAISKMPLIRQVNSWVGLAFAVFYFAIKIVILVALLGTPMVKNGNAVVERSLLKPIQDVSQPVLDSLVNVISRNEALQSVLFKQELTPEQAISLTKWLQKNGFTHNEIKEFLSKYE